MLALCEQIRVGLTTARGLLPFVYTGVGVSEFYDVYRPLLGGWAPRGLQLPPLPHATRPRAFPVFAAAPASGGAAAASYQARGQGPILAGTARSAQPERHFGTAR